MDDHFLKVPFTRDEVLKARNMLHFGKAPGFDGVMSEHLSYAGSMLVDILCILYNTIRSTEYIPLCFKLGVQVPLYKGKDTCILDPNNYNYNSDDFKYKNQMGTTRMCNLCDNFEIEDARHFILVCPYFAQQRSTMLNEIEAVIGVSGPSFFDDNVDMLYTLLGRPHSNVNETQTETILLIILRTVASMYRENMRQKKV